MDNIGLRVNEGKASVVSAGGEDYKCYAIKTRVVTERDSFRDIVRSYAKPCAKNGDILFISEKMLACAQGRAIPVKAIKAGFLARFLCRFVAKTKAGIGLSMPETMQCAIDECGVPRILLAAAAGMAGKLFRRKGWFYKVAGSRAACIDGPCSYTIPPYNECVVLAPLNPDKAALEASEELGGITVLIVDINDLGGRTLGKSHKINERRILELLRQNPLGQARESTPMGILRRELKKPYEEAAKYA